jgi:hypothetical protein
MTKDELEHKLIEMITFWRIRNATLATPMHLKGVATKHDKHVHARTLHAHEHA